MDTPSTTLVFERKKKYVQLPPSLNSNKETVLQILHNHYLLRQKIWRLYAVTSYKAQPGTTIFNLTATHPAILHVKLTLTNHDDGVSALEQMDLGLSSSVRWSVTQEEYVGGNDEDRSLVNCLRQQKYLLEESFTVRGSRLLWWSHTIFQSHHVNTRCLIWTLEDIADEEARKIDSNDGKFKHE